MRLIGSIPQADDAERFSDYLVTQKIENMVEESAGGSWAVWVEHDDDLVRARGELVVFLTNPADARYDAQHVAKKIRREEEKKAEKRRENFIDYRTRWSQAKQWAAPVTIALLILSAAVSIGTNSINVGAPREREVDLFRFAPAGPFRDWWMHHADASDQSLLTLKYVLSFYQAGQVWRVVTPILIHYSILHLLFNMFWLKDLGGMIELQRGSWKLIRLVIVCALVSNIAQFLWMLPHPPTFGGMSGVVYGLFGYVWVKQKMEPQLGLGIAQQSIWIMMAWLFLCMTGFAGDIANAAHVVGLIVGAGWAAAPVAWRRAMR